MSITGRVRYFTLLARHVQVRFTPATPGFISREVMVELVWVLERAYPSER